VAVLAAEARERAAGLAVAVVDGDDVAIHLDAGADALTTSTLFDVGSVAKTFTALLLAHLRASGTVETPVRGEGRGSDGVARAIVRRHSSLGAERSNGLDEPAFAGDPPSSGDAAGER